MVQTSQQKNSTCSAVPDEEGVSRVHSRGRRRWSRATRLTVYTIANVLTIAVLIACLGGIGFLLARCEGVAPNSTVLCSDNGRLLTVVLGFGGLAAIFFPWCRFLTRALWTEEEDTDPATDETSVPSHSVSWTSEQNIHLPLGQHIVSGTVESVNVNSARHRVTVHGMPLRFWGGHALRNGSIRAGDWVAFGYQQIPLCSLKYVLVFWKGGALPVQSVGAVIHACFLLLAIVGITTFPLVKEGYPAWFLTVCGALAIESCLYLLLLLFARRALNDLVDQSP